MTTKPCLLALFLAAVAGSGRAQPASLPPGPPPPPPAGADPYYYNFGAPGANRAPGDPGSGSFAEGATVLGAITVPYAFDWHAVGVSGELGGLFRNQHFLGAELSYYSGDARRYNVYGAGNYLGSFRSRQDITTLDVAYRYFTPLGSDPAAPVSFYLGGGVGAAFVDFTNRAAAYGFRHEEDAAFTGEALLGVQFSPVGRGFGARLGYRYIFVNDAWRYDRRVDLDSSVLEASLTLRF